MYKNFIGLIVSGYILFGMGNFAFAEEAGLVAQLVKNLGVTTQQAKGGAGAIFNTAKQDMGVEDFSKISTAIPEIGSLLTAAPKTENSSSTLGAVSSLLSNNTGSIGKLAGLSQSFSKLGLSNDMIAQFMPIVLEYAKSKGGDIVSKLLTSALQ